MGQSSLSQMGPQHSVMGTVGTIAAVSMGTVGLGLTIVPALGVLTTGERLPRLLSLLLGVSVLTVGVARNSRCLMVGLLSVMVEVRIPAAPSGVTVVQVMPTVPAPPARTTGQGTRS